MPSSVSPVVTIGTSPVGAGVEAIVVVGAVVVLVVVVVVVVVTTSSHLSPVHPVYEMERMTLRRLTFAWSHIARKLTSN